MENIEQSDARLKYIEGVSSCSMMKGTIYVRRPTPATFSKSSAPAFKLNDPIAGKTVGLRTDHAWRSWRLIADIWSEYLVRDGAVPITIEAGTQAGKVGAAERNAIEEMALKVDCAIVGLGTCGSCTTYTIRDSVIIEDAGKPVVAMICEEFIVHARHVAANVEHADLKTCVLPYPLEALPEAELRGIADEFYPKVLELLGATR